MKRIFAMILCMVLCFSMGVGFHSYAQENTSDFSEEIAILKAIGVIKGYKNGTFLLDEPVTRAELAMLCVGAMGFDESVVPEDVFYHDVPKTYWATPYIAHATNMKLMVGYEGLFNPDSKVTLQQASKVMVQMLGYEQKAIAKGGYPAGYMAVASEHKILSGIGSSAELTRGQVAKMLLNTLEAEAMEFDGVKNNEATHSSQNKRLMEITLGVAKERGRIQSNAISSLLGNATCGQNEISIEDKIYTTSTTEYNDFLGRDVWYYYEITTEEKPELLYCKLANQNSEILTVVSDDILGSDPSFNTRKFVYSDEKDRTQTKNIDGAVVFVNGKVLSGQLVKNDLIPTDGEVVLIDDNNDNRIDLVKVFSWRTAMVAGANTRTSVVTDKLGGLPVNCDGTTPRIVEIFKDGKSALFSSLKEWDILLVTESRDQKYIRIEASSKTVQGEITEYSSEDQTVTIGEAVYRLNPKMTNISEKIGGNYQFRIDSQGRIVTAEQSEFVNGGYAYLFQIAPKNGFSSQIRLKMLTQSGEIEIFESTEKIVFNEEGKLDASTVYSRICPQGADANTLILYTTNLDGLVNKIYTPQADSPYLTPDYSEGERSFSVLANIFGLYETEGFFIDSEAPIFYIVNGDADECKLITAESLVDKTAYTVAGYNAGDTMTPDAIVMKVQEGASGNMPLAYDTPIAIIKQISVGVNDDEEQVPVFTLITNGQELRLMGKEAGKINVRKVLYPNRTQTEIPFSELQAGDIIYYDTNYKNEIEIICKVLPYVKNTGISERPEWISEHGWSNEKVFGTVERMSGNLAEVSVNGTKYLFSLAGASVTSVNVANNKISVGSIDEIVPRKLDAVNYSKVFLSVGTGQTTTVIVYNNWNE